jgi:hypothetical protein
MLRRCLESPTPFFGMIMPPKAGCPLVDYGTILEIRSVQMFPDGPKYGRNLGFHSISQIRKRLHGWLYGWKDRKVSIPPPTVIDSQ